MPITDRQRERRQQYKENRKLGMTRPNAAIAAGFARSIAMRKQPPAVVTDFQALFEQKGITDQKKVEKAIEGMNAEKLFIDKLGKKHVTPDWQARYKYLELTLQLCKQLDKGGKGGGDTNVLFIK